MMTRSRPVRVLTLAAAALTVMGAVAVAASSIDRPASRPSVRAARVDPPQPVVVIGDSAISALRWVPHAASAIVGFDPILDLESCRRLVDLSCRGREGRTPPTTYEALGNHGDRYRTLVVATGYNDAASGWGDAFDLVVSRARALGYRRVIWYSLRSDVSYVSPGARGTHAAYAEMNAELRRRLASGHYSDVVLADWAGYTADKSDWFESDGVHYRAVGTWAAADYLTRKMAHLDGEPCPFPIAPSQPVQDPCPDPDVTGAVADIAALYPIGEDNVRCYEVGDERRYECRAYDTPPP